MTLYDDVGLGSIWASVGATHIDSDEKLCPQYMLRTDDLEYHVRPMDHKHPVILPVGKEVEFKPESKLKFILEQPVEVK